ncbi:MAG: ergothioneine biosynthesis protein EgtB [Acidobacteria bacterium]|nr:MAG: ergothioneine biosynthesis protein EgtB [Acidobacteriota bacterium]
MAITRQKVYSASGFLTRLADARSATDKLFEIPLRDALYDRPIPERHRIVFYIGHLEAFDWNLLGIYGFGLKPFQPELDKLFAFGIDPVEGGLPSDQPSDWPMLEEVHQYNRRVRQELDSRLRYEPLTEDGGDLSQFGVYVHVAVEHRLMHAETLAYMLHQLPLRRKVKQPAANATGAPIDIHRMIEIPAGTATMGLLKSGRVFGWDNEFELNIVEVPTFAIDEYKVTNGQFLRFLRAGGYETESLWSGPGWEWIRHEGIRHPCFWVPYNGSWNYRTMFDEVPLPLDWPVYVSHAEAAAYARWAGKRLPTEAEFHRAAYGTRHGEETDYPWGSSAPEKNHGNFGFWNWDPAPVQAHPAGRSSFGVAGLVGNGWEWTSTVFTPFGGFEPFPFYRGYSANFFDGKHYVMKGGSPRTAVCMLRRSFRNWFQPHYQYAYSGFRCVSS